MADGKPDGGAEQFLGLAIIAVFVAICLYFIYTAYTAEIHSFVRWIRYAEMWIVSVLTPDSYAVTLTNGDKINLKEWLDAVAKIPKERIDINLLLTISAVALLPYKWIVIAIIALMAIWANTKGPNTQFKTVFNLDKFIRFQSKAFPITAPFAEFNPCNQPPRPPGSDVPAELPLFAEALGPEEWLAYKQIPVTDNKIDEAKAAKAFSEQLGKRWRGPKHLSPDKQILLAGFCLKASRKRVESDDIMSRVAMCWSHKGGLDLSKDKTLLRKARAVLKNKELSGKVLQNCKQHAWETTAMLRALLVAREEGGVLAPAQFVWLRGHDRNLWYPLNNLGRQSNHIEALGAAAHFRIERRAKRPVPYPKMEEAVRSIREYMESLDARPIPKLDYSQSKNTKGIKKLKSA